MFRHSLTNEPQRNRVNISVDIGDWRYLASLSSKSMREAVAIAVRHCKETNLVADDMIVVDGVCYKKVE